MNSDNRTFNPHSTTMVWVDLDDTIWDFTRNSATTLRQMYAAEPILQHLFADDRQWYHCYEAVNKALWDDYSASRVDRSTLRRERFRRPLADAGLDNDSAIAKADQYDTLYLHMLGRKRALVQGARSLLEYLHTRGYGVGVLSNGFQEVQYRKMQSSGIRHLIDVVVLSDEIDINKPDTRLFDYAVRKSAARFADTPALQDPRHHTIIGDNIHTDIAGALRAGWGRAIWFDRDGLQQQRWPYGPDTNMVTIPPAIIYRITHLDQARSIL